MPVNRDTSFVDHLPQNCIWNVSVMNPQKQWDLLALAVSLGGHVRGGGNVGGHPDHAHEHQPRRQATRELGRPLEHQGGAR